MEVIEAWWRNVVIAVLGPCFLLAAAIAFHAEEKTAPLFAGLASGITNATNAALEATQPLLLLPDILREHSDAPLF